MSSRESSARHLVTVTAQQIVSHEHAGLGSETRHDLATQQTSSLNTAGLRITVRSEGGKLQQLLIEIDSNRNGSFSDINDAFFSIDPLAQRITAGMGDEGGVIQSPEVVAGVLMFIDQLRLADPEAFEQDMRTLAQYVSQSTEQVIRTIANLR